MYPLNNPIKFKPDIPNVNAKSKLTSYSWYSDLLNFLEVFESFDNHFVTHIVEL